MQQLNQITVTDIVGLFNIMSPEGKYLEIHNRQSYGLSFCSEGRITYTMNGKETVSDSHHAVILPQGQSYALYGNQTGIFPVINFTCADSLCSEIVSLPLQIADVYMKQFRKIEALYLFRENRAMIMSIFYEMLSKLSSETSSSNVIAPAIRYLEQHYQDPKLTNADLARECHISEVWFRKLFMEHFRIAPKQFIVEIRMNRAKQLLAEGRLKISAIAECCGFSNQYHFCRLFREKNGLTPTEYRMHYSKTAF